MWNEGETSEEIGQRQERRAKEISLSSLHLGFCFLNYFSLPPRNSNSNIIRIISLLNKQKERDILLNPVDGF